MAETPTSTSQPQNKYFCPLHKIRAYASFGWYGRKVECHVCLREGRDQTWALKYHLPLEKLSDVERSLVMPQKGIDE